MQLAALAQRSIASAFLGSTVAGILIVVASCSGEVDPPLPTEPATVTAPATEAAIVPTFHAPRAGVRPRLIPSPVPPGGDESAVAADGLRAAAGEVAACELPIDENNQVLRATFVLDGHGSRFEVMDGNGDPVERRRSWQGEMAPNVVVHEFEFDAPASHRVRVVLSAGSDEPAALHVEVRFDNGIRLAVGVWPEPQPSGAATVQAVLADRNGETLTGLSDEWSFALTSPGGNETRSFLYDDGAHDDGAALDGVFGARLGSELLTEKGNYDVRAQARSTIAGRIVVRSAVTMFGVRSDAVAFAGPARVETRDVDGDGRIDHLDFVYVVVARKPGPFRLVGWLRDARGGALNLTADAVAHCASTMEVALSVDGVDLVRAGQRGPWTLAGVSLAEGGVGFTHADDSPEPVTADFPLESFELPAGPTIRNLWPSRAPSVGGEEVLVQGSGLYGTTRVTIDGVEARFDFRDDSTLGVVVPRSARGPGRVHVEVTTRWGTAELAHGFLYE